ncbi:hypothetical protein CspeluHIS016_0207470 [Cutaneotrichosporon spelunceum]|uniref:DNA polymerase phi-domain-containing protein n=1 Tax=Cutaneotrichosporon spelunceum TaxID=1672016 RepID=A0AAD3TRM9_9TREE|nr:hypothetical protein CspeluHIS016_0207470 [Cutaneotrichosporon spelunceum]
MASNVLPLFWDLASSSRDKRLGASADLVAAAQAFQAAYSAPEKASGDEDDDDEDDGDEDGSESGMEVDDDGDEEEGPAAVDPVLAAKLDAALARNNAPDVVYSIKRLVRGLGSSREHSRLGFAVALTELLARSQNVTAAQVISLLLRASQWSKGMKGSDERDMMFARLFGIMAIVDSDLLFASSATLDDLTTVVDSLLALADAKAWLAEAAGWALLRVAEGLIASEVEWKDEALAAITERVYADRVWSPEKAALTLALQRGAPELDWKALLAPTFKTTPLLASANLITLGRVLKEGGEDDARTGMYQPKLHYVWDGILAEYFTHSTQGIASFAEFFRTVVDEALFANTSSAERKYWGFQVFERALPLLPAESVPLIFTPNFMRSWMNNLSSSDRHLHKAAVQVARKVNEHVKADPTAGFTLLSQLVGKHGRPDFDRVTKTKTVEGIMSSLSVDGVEKYVAYLENVLVSEDEGGLDERRTWALDQMLALARNGAVPRADGWISRVLNTLLVHGFFLIRKADKRSKITALRAIPKPPLSDVVAATARARFYSALVEVTAHKEDGKEGTDSAGKLWLTRALDTMAALEKNSAVELVSDADDEIKKLRADAVAALAPLGDEPVARGARILVSFLVLQTYDEAEDALDMLDEAVGAVRALFPAKKRGSKKAKVQPEVDADAPPPVDALLDVLVALLDKGSADLRTLANQVFGMLVPAMTVSAVEHLVAQLEQSGAAAEAEDEDDEEHEHGPDCDHSDEEDDEDDDEDESDSETVASDDTDANAEVDPEFRRRVAEALKVSGVLDDKEDDEDADSDDESVWDDEQMMKVDEQLAAVFKQQASSKKADLKHAAIESLHFKNRILDFFDVFLRRPTSLALALLLPLLHIVRGGGELGNKAAGILRTRLKSTSLSASTDKTELEQAGKILAEIHLLARRAPTSEFSGLCSAASLFAARVAPAQALEEYKTTLADFVTRKHSGVQPAFLQEYARRHAGKAWPLSGEILALLKDDKAANAYRHVQAYALLGALLSQAPALVKAGELTTKEAREVVEGAMGDVYSVLEAAAESGEWKADRLKDAAKFALVVARTARALEIGEACDAPRLKEVAEAVKGGRTKEMKGVHALLMQLGAVLSKKEGKAAKATKEGKQAKGKGKKAVNGGDEEKEEPKSVTGKRKATAATAVKGKKKAKAE